MTESWLSLLMTMFSLPRDVRSCSYNTWWSDAVFENVFPTSFPRHRHALENPTLGVAPFVLAPATPFGIQNQVHAHSVQSILKVQVKISLA